MDWLMGLIEANKWLKANDLTSADARNWFLIFWAISGLIMAGLGILMAFWRNLTAGRQAFVAEANHLAETYTKAIDQLGNEKNEIKLGGLYALEKIAKSNKEYYEQIMEVFCAFVRMHAPLGKNEEENSPPPELTIRPALTIIGRRNVKFEELSRIKRVFNRCICCLNKPIFSKSYSQMWCMG